MHFNDFPFLRYAVCLIAGILLYPLFRNLDTSWFYAVFLVLFSAYYLLLSKTVFRPEFQNRLPISFLGLSLWVCFGLLLAAKSDPGRIPHHVTNLEEMEGYFGMVAEADEQKPRTRRNLIHIRKVLVKEKWQEAEGKIIIYHRDTLKPGQLVFVPGIPQRVSPPGNPNEFDYRLFLARQQIFHTHFVREGIQIVGEINDRPISNFFLSLRTSLEERLDRFVPDIRANQIAKALLLGQKNTLDKEVSEAYSTAGAMHVLAVSGLHVGIIYGFFFMLIKPARLKVRWRVIYLGLVILLIWVYAFLTGMSPSVMRSATMFTVMALAQMQSRSPATLNAVAVSAVLLLLFDPNLVYAVGFQLSYAALLGILLLQPIIVKLWLPHNRVLNYVWEITAVGIAAQLATFPITATYFHQFPTYFMVSNIIAIPGAFLIMAMGIPFLILSLVEWIGGYLGGGLNGVIRLFNFLIFRVQEIPFSKVEAIQITAIELVGYYFLLLLLYSLYFHPEKKMVYLGMVVLLAGIVFNWLSLVRGPDEVVVYSMQKGKAVDYFQGGSVYGWHEQVDADDRDYKILPYRLARGVKPNNQFTAPPELSGKLSRDLTNLPVRKAYCFENGYWNEVNFADIDWSDQRAYRLILDKEGLPAP